MGAVLDSRGRTVRLGIPIIGYQQEIALLDDSGKVVGRATNFVDGKLVDLMGPEFIEHEALVLAAEINP